MSKFTAVILLLICFGAATGFVEQMHIFSATGGSTIKQTGMSGNNSAMTDFGNGVSNQAADGSGVFSLILAGGKILFSAGAWVLACGFMLYPMLLSIGVDPLMAVPFCALAQCGALWSFFEFAMEILGRYI